MRPRHAIDEHLLYFHCIRQYCDKKRHTHTISEFLLDNDNRRLVNAICVVGYTAITATTAVDHRLSQSLRAGYLSNHPYSILTARVNLDETPFARL